MEYFLEMKIEGKGRLLDGEIRSLRDRLHETFSPAFSFSFQAFGLRQVLINMKIQVENMDPKSPTSFEASFGRTPQFRAGQLMNISWPSPSFPMALICEIN